ncbi:tyrosine-type recombinase/integrase [Angustibacter sp. McL0619]|uniref:tyrosine-type recombinase/integrase n=1 Tax=Angustibacter sp. McL0619 TaxID=3415676 RepID=UPI003CE9CF49
MAGDSDRPRRARGEGTCYFEQARSRWVAEANLGFDARGKPDRVRRTGKSKSAALASLKKALKAREDGDDVGPVDYRVRDALADWLRFGLPRADKSTVAKCKSLCRVHIEPALGKRRLRELTSKDVERWLEATATVLATSSLRHAHSCLNRAVKHAMKHDLVRRNVVELCEIPNGRPGRPSKALTAAQAEAVLRAARGSQLHEYIVVSLLTGARTEEMRELRWSHVDLVGRPKADPPVPPHMLVWRSVRASGDTKTRKSRRTLALPGRCVDVLTVLRARRRAAGQPCSGEAFVFATSLGTGLDAANVRRAFRAAITGAPGIKAKEWTPRELRHSFVSLLSDNGVPLETISRLVGHRNTTTTELVYRKQIRPVIDDGAVAMDGIFGRDEPPESDGGSAA